MRYCFSDGVCNIQGPQQAFQFKWSYQRGDSDLNIHVYRYTGTGSVPVHVKCSRT